MSIYGNFFIDPAKINDHPEVKAGNLTDFVKKQPATRRDHGGVFLFRIGEDPLHEFSQTYPNGITESSDKRKATPGRLVTLAAACNYHIDETQWREDLRSAAQVRTLWDGDILIGFGLMRNVHGVAIFDRALIRPRYRGQGLFRTMFGKALQSLQTDDVDELLICADTTSAALYEKLGWREVIAPSQDIPRKETR